MDLTKVSFFIEGMLSTAHELGDVSFSHVRHVLAHTLGSKALEEYNSSLFHTPYSEWYTLLVSHDVIP